MKNKSSLAQYKIVLVYKIYAWTYEPKRENLNKFKALFAESRSRLCVLSHIIVTVVVFLVVQNEMMMMCAISALNLDKNFAPVKRQMRLNKTKTSQSN